MSKEFVFCFCFKKSRTEKKTGFKGWYGINDPEKKFLRSWC